MPSSPLVLAYEVYAFDNSVRTAWLDSQRGFFNGTSLCLQVHGREEQPHGLTLAQHPKEYPGSSRSAAPFCQKSNGVLNPRAHYQCRMCHQR